MRTNLALVDGIWRRETTYIGCKIASIIVCQLVSSICLRIIAGNRRLGVKIPPETEILCIVYQEGRRYTSA